MAGEMDSQTSLKLVDSRFSRPPASVSKVKRSRHPASTYGLHTCPATCAYTYMNMYIHIYSTQILKQIVGGSGEVCVVLPAQGLSALAIL